MEIQAKLDLGDWNKFVTTKSGPGLAKELDAGLEEAGALVEAAGRAGAPVGATQMVRGSHYHKPIAVAGGAPAVEVGASAPHAVFVHEGRTPGRMPPPDALKAWLRFKGIDESAAWPIGRALAARGTKGRPWLRKAFEQSVDKIVAIIARRVGA